MVGTNLDLRTLLLIPTVVFKFMHSPLCTWYLCIYRPHMGCKAQGTRAAFNICET